MTLKLSDPDQLTANQRKLEDRYAAVSIADAEITKEERDANSKLLESVKHERLKCGNKFAQAFIDLHTAHLEYDQFIDDLEDAGASVGQFRIRPNGLSHPKDRSGNYFYALQEFIEAGFLQKMPKVLTGDEPSVATRYIKKVLK